MDTPVFTDGQFVNAAALASVTNAINSNLDDIGTNLHTQGLTGLQYLLTPSGLQITVSCHPNFGVLFANGTLVRPHGTVSGSDSSTYTVDTSSFVPSSGSVIVYIVASQIEIGQNQITVVGPPQGHPDYNPNFASFNFYTTQRDSLNIVATETAPDGQTAFELCRVTLTPGQVSITSQDIDTSHIIYASSILNPTGVIPGSYSNASVTVGADGRVTAIGSATSAILGEIKMWPMPTVPAGYLVCGGQAVSRTTYSELFSVLGTYYGSGDGSTTFNLPDMRGRAPFGGDGMGGALAGRLQNNVCGVDGSTIGAVGGDQNLSRHTHLFTDPGHSHSINDPTHNHYLNDPQHVHGVYDVGHTHSVYDPSHNHGISDPGHAHAVADPGHAHQLPGGTSFGDAAAIGQAQASITGYEPYLTIAALTGIGIYAAGTGIGIAAHTTGISLYAATTGISIEAHSTGTYNSPSGTGISLAAAFTGMSLNYAGSGGSQNVPPAFVLNFIIYAGA